MLRLPLVAELGDGARFAERDEDRIEAEALVAGGPERDPAFEHAGAPRFGAVGRDRDQLADVARVAIVASLQGGKQLLDVAVLGPTRGLHARPAAQRCDLDP